MVSWDVVTTGRARDGERARGLQASAVTMAGEFASNPPEARHELWLRPPEPWRSPAGGSSTETPVAKSRPSPGRALSI